jgi:protein TonB
MHAVADTYYFLFEKRKPMAANGLFLSVVIGFLVSYSVADMWPEDMNKSDALMEIDLQTYAPVPPERVPPRPLQNPPAPVVTPTPKVPSLPTSIAETPVDALPTPQVPEMRAKGMGQDSRPVEAVPAARASASFESVIKAAIEAKKSYPTGRQAMLERPVGTVGLCMLLSRAGKLLESRIAVSSGSILLDGAARRLVSSISFPAFPETYLVGKGQNEFCVRLKYELPN